MTEDEEKAAQDLGSVRVLLPNWLLGAVDEYHRIMFGDPSAARPGGVVEFPRPQPQPHFAGLAFRRMVAARRNKRTAHPAEKVV